MSLAYASVRIQIAKNKPKALKPDDFNPFAKLGKYAPIPADITVLKALVQKRPKKK